VERRRSQYRVAAEGQFDGKGLAVPKGRGKDQAQQAFHQIGMFFQDRQVVDGLAKFRGPGQEIIEIIAQVEQVAFLILTALQGHVDEPVEAQHTAERKIVFDLVHGHPLREPGSGRATPPPLR
jgi:hypothetical protein